MRVEVAIEENGQKKLHLLSSLLLVQQNGSELEHGTTMTICSVRRQQSSAVSLEPPGTPLTLPGLPVLDLVNPEVQYITRIFPVPYLRNRNPIQKNKMMYVICPSSVIGLPLLHHHPKLKLWVQKQSFILPEANCGSTQTCRWPEECSYGSY